MAFMFECVMRFIRSRLSRRLAFFSLLILGLFVFRFTVVEWLAIVVTAILVAVIVARNANAAAEFPLAVRLGFDGLAIDLALASGTALAACGLLIGLEAVMPNYFFQDDNVMQFQPMLTRVGRELFAGRLLNYDFGEFLGRPIFEVGTYAAFYPVTGLSYAVAKALGNERMIVDVFCIVHLTGAAFALFLLARYLGISRAFSFLAALAYALDGFNLIVGRSWYYVTPYVCFLPVAFLGLLLIMGAAKANAEAGGRWAGAGLLCGAVGVSLYGGNAQFWVYLNLSVVVFVLAAFFTSHYRLSDLWLIGGALSVAYAIASFQLIPQLLYVADVDRSRAMLDFGIKRNLLAVIFPWPITVNLYPDAPGGVSLPAPGEIDTWARNANLYTLGPVFAIGWLVHLFFVVRTRGWRAIGVLELLSALAVIAFCTTFGRYSPIWVAMNRLPMFEKFWWSFKLVPFTDFFAIATAAVVVDRVVRERWSRGAVWLVGMATVLVVLLTSRAALLLYPSELLESRGEVRGLSEFLATLTPGSTRVHPVPPKSLHSDFKMNRQIALSGVLSTRGYDPLVDRSRANMSVRLEDDDDFRRWGIDYLVTHSWKSGPSGFTDLGGGYYFRAVSSPLPLAYLEKSGAKVEVALTGSKDALAIGDPIPSGENLVLNFLARSGIVVTDAAGIAVPHWRDEFGRIIVEGGRAGGLKVAYRIDFFWAFVFSALCLLAASVFAILASLGPNGRRGAFSVR